MKALLFTFALIMAPISFAQSQASSPAPASAVLVSPTSPAPAASAAVAPAVSAPTVAVAAPSAPPAWVQALLSTVAGLPIIGPYVSQALMYLGILGAILTALVAFLNAAALALKSVVNWSGLTTLSSWIQSFQQSSVMYWLTALSNIPVHVTPAAASTPAPPASGVAS